METIVRLTYHLIAIIILTPTHICMSVLFYRQITANTNTEMYQKYIYIRRASANFRLNRGWSITFEKNSNLSAQYSHEYYNCLWPTINLRALNCITDFFMVLCSYWDLRNQRTDIEMMKMIHILNNILEKFFW